MASAIASTPRAVKVFISYSTKDTDLAKRIVDRIEREQGISCFLAPRNIPAGEYWEPQLEEALRSSEVILLIYTPSSAASEYVRQEIRSAQTFRTQVLMLKDPGLKIDPFFDNFGFTKRQAFPMLAGAEIQALDPVIASLNTVWKRLNPGTGTVDPNDSPYPGFQPFDESRTKYYFGREQDCESLANTIYEGAGKLLLVYGPSGVGKSSLLRVGLPDRLVAGDWLSRPILFSSYKRGANRALFLLRAALDQLRGRGDNLKSQPPGLDTSLIAEIEAEIQKQQYRCCVFCFDQMEELFGQTDNEPEIDEFLIYARRLLQNPSVRILVSFREESLGTVERRIDDLKIACGRWRIRKLSTEAAKQSIVGPAAARGVEFSTTLADELVKVLASPHGRDINYQLVYGVEPVSLQLVCKSLWETVGNSPARVDCRIHEGSLPPFGRNLHERVKHFVDGVVKTYLANVIDEMAEARCPAGAPDRDSKKKQLIGFIQTSLILFVDSGKSGQKRQRVAETVLPNGETRVGRLSSDLVTALVNKGLVHKCDDAPEYELVHDVLAEAIDREYRGNVELLPKLNILESNLRNAKLAGFFNANATLVHDLEEARRLNLHFWDDEAEYLVRCALGDQRRNVQGEEISMVGWAEMLGKNSPKLLAQVFADALTENTEPDPLLDPVRQDVIELLRNPELRETLKTYLPPLIEQIRELALHGSVEVRESASGALVEMNAAPDIHRIFELCQKGDRAARDAIVLLRHAFDLAAGTKQAFQQEWARLAPWRRLGALVSLCWFRFRQSFARIVFILTLTTPATMIGASIPFAFCGIYGASLTLDNSATGFAKGIFHGVSGGMVWGFGSGLALLLYGVIWKGGRIGTLPMERLALFLWATIGSAIAGFANTLLIGSVFSEDALYQNGWTAHAVLADYGQRFHDFMVVTRCGWALPILGAGLGAGVCWSLSKLQGERWAASLNSIGTIRETMGVIRTICASVFLKNWWRNTIPVAIAGVICYYVVLPGPGVCDPHAAVFDPVCAAAHPIASLPYRAAGLALVILSGSLFFEAAFLFGVILSRVGLNVQKNLDFLRYKGRDAAG